VQFHLETPAELAAEWLGIDIYRRSLHEALGPHGEATLLDALREAQTRLIGHARTLMGEWLNQFILAKTEPVSNNAGVVRAPLAPTADPPRRRESPPRSP
jgi:hypothetical protein